MGNKHARIGNKSATVLGISHLFVFGGEKKKPVGCLRVGDMRELLVYLMVVVAALAFKSNTAWKERKVSQKVLHSYRVIVIMHTVTARVGSSLVEVDVNLWMTQCTTSSVADSNTFSNVVNGFFADEFDGSHGVRLLWQVSLLELGTNKSIGLGLLWSSPGGSSVWSLFDVTSEGLYRWVGRNSGCVFSNNVAKHGWLRWLEKQCKALFFFDRCPPPTSPPSVTSWLNE